MPESLTLNAAPGAPAVRRVEAVVNALSGSTGPNAAAELEAILDARGLQHRVVNAAPADLASSLEAAVAARPDLLIVLAGDGTARLACELAGPEGPLVAPLPGGTMNMLPRAFYGALGWKAALDAALERGAVREVSGGEVEGRSFYVAAILGAPALWAPAREALRKGRWRLAVGRARHALKRAFSGRLRYRLDGGQESKAEALTVICPLVSRARPNEAALDVAALDPKGAAEGLRLGARTLLADVLGDWRQDPAVASAAAQTVKVEGRWRRLPAVLDGEPCRLPAKVVVRFRPRAFRALALPEVDPAEAEGGQGEGAVALAAGAAATVREAL